MSKIGRKPIIIPQGVTVDVSQHAITISHQGKMVTVPLLPAISCTQEGDKLMFHAKQDSQQARANWGTVRALTQNAVRGVTQDFVKELEFEGIGFKASLEGKTLVLHVGFSHPVRFEPPPGVTLQVVKNIIIVSGSDKAVVGAVSSEIRSIKKPEPYKGKGIHYKGEVIRRKAGKKVGATTGAAA